LNGACLCFDVYRYCFQEKAVANDQAASRAWDLEAVKINYDAFGTQSSEFRSIEGLSSIDRSLSRLPAVNDFFVKKQEIEPKATVDLPKYEGNGDAADKVW